VQRVAALDIGESSLVCCLHVPRENGCSTRRQPVVRTYIT